MSAEVGTASPTAPLAFDDFVRARLPYLLRFALALTGDDHAAADLVQDALERTLPRWRRIAGTDPERYIRRVMVNRNISVWRKLSRERLTDRVPEATVTDPDRDEALFAALRKLAPRQRACVVLRYLEDQTEAQTAELLGCSVGTVKRQTHLAMAHLRDLLHVGEEESR